jgi:hypothetical protein
MSGSIILGVNKNGQSMSELVNGVYWDAFGELLDAALSNYQNILGVIKCEPGKYLKYYSFVELDGLQFNIVVKQIRLFIHELKTPSEWEAKAISVWVDVCEQYVIQDDRYDESFYLIE